MNKSIITLFITQLVLIAQKEAFCQSESFSCPVLHVQKLDSCVYNKGPMPGLTVESDSNIVLAPFNGKVSKIQKKNNSFNITLTDDKVFIAYNNLHNCKVGENEIVYMGQTIGELDRYANKYLLWLIILGPRKELISKKKQLTILRSYCQGYDQTRTQ